MIRTRAHANVPNLMNEISNALKKIDLDYLPRVCFLNEIQENLYQKDILLGKQIALFSIVAFFISLVGVFGVVMFESEYKKKEIGIRKVFGATTQEILQMCNKTYIHIVAICFIMAAPVAWCAIQSWRAANENPVNSIKNQ